MRRDKVLEFVLHCDYFPISVESDSLNNDYDALYKMLCRRKINHIAMAKEIDKNLIWFRLRRS
jgi:hypothetical protein